METLRGKAALVIGASSGVGKATAKALLHEGARITAVARGAEGLERLRSEVNNNDVTTVRGDASDAALAQRLLTEVAPDFVVLAAGAAPRMGPLTEQTWESFSEPWNVDTRAAFQWTQLALCTPLRPGSTLVVVSSGAALHGSPLSGGYAGAKRMQWLLAEYAQQVADANALQLRFLAVLPTQLIADTKIGIAAANAYGPRQQMSGAELMRQYAVPLSPDMVAAAILSGLRGEIQHGVTAIGVNGHGVEPLV